MSQEKPSFIKSLLEPKRQKILFFLLTIILGIFCLYPLRNFQTFLAQGDHGRDLYCFKLVMEGALPYRDFSWLFGPLMPYYYAFFYKLFGVSIQSVLLGQNILILLTGLVMYGTCALFLSPVLSFICATWYWGLRDTEFFYTYNHSGGLLFLVLTLYFLFRYIKTHNFKNIWPAFIAAFLFIFVRLNMGVSTLVGLTSCLILIDFIRNAPQASRRRGIYILVTIVCLLAAFGIYWLLVHDLADYKIDQSFPYAQKHRTDIDSNIGSTLITTVNIFWSYFSSSWITRFFGIILLLCLIRLIDSRYRQKITDNSRTFLIPVFLSLTVFLILSLHEFIASGVFYRLDWIKPLMILLMFFILGFGSRHLSSTIIRLALLAIMFTMFVLHISNQHLTIKMAKKSPYYLAIGPNRLHTLQTPDWFVTVTGAVDYLKANVPENEKIFALPLEPLYYFLSERDAGTSQLAFFEHFLMPTEQEVEVIRDLERNRVNWVIVSNRSFSIEGGLGTFGQTYCPLLARYLDQHFQFEIQYGPWNSGPSWAWNHGVRIFKRTSWMENKKDNE